MERWLSKWLPTQKLINTSIALFNDDAKINEYRLNDKDPVEIVT